MPACSDRKCPSSFEEGGRFYHPCAADIADATPYQSTASPIRALPTRAAPIRAAPIRAAPAPLRPPVTPTLTSLTSLPQPVTPTLTSPPPLRLPPATPTLTLPTSLPPLSDTEAPHGPQPLPLGPKSRTARAPSPILPKAPPRTASLLQFCPEPPSRRPRHKKRRTEPHRGPSAAKKQPICRGSITAAALQPVRSVHAPETDPFRIVRAGISG